ncbi:hypothetical protein GOM49_07250 [Clostridium bovifaecis]|uniref:DUF7852 domain-containing protein n=1 Tax=Clostridium bovifaecis TaxID=2184719 RepID=A0A6I6EMI6_9CLOT|nr:hypothetical protein GOM49_07250 [Clostridium bovifaecis]
MLNNRFTNDCDAVSPQQEECNSGIINPVTLSECDSECSEPMGRKGPVVVKVPVVLTECKVQIDVEADIRLEQRAFDIKTIDKKVCLTQCHLVPHTNKLFLRGYIQKNIQYSTVECVSEDSVSGNVQHTTVNVPFHCVTAVKFDKLPMFGKSFKERLTALDDNMVCPDNEEDSWVHFNKYHEPIFCELEWVKVLESDIYNRNRACAEGFTEENCFRRFTEKMVIYLGIKVLQNQQVCIPKPVCKKYKMKDHDKYDEYDEYDEYDKCDKYEKYDKYDEYNKCDEHDKHDKYERYDD